MIDRIHRHAAHMRSATLPARASGFAARNVHVIDVADLTDRRVRVFVNAANFAGRKFDQRVTTLAVA